jgi:hypothetical protein
VKKSPPFFEFLKTRCNFAKVQKLNRNVKILGLCGFFEFALGFGVWAFGLGLIFANGAIFGLNFGGLKT